MTAGPFCRRLGFLLALAATLCPAAFARQDPAAITRAVQGFVRVQGKSLPGRVEWEITPPDPRLQLADCPHLHVALPAGARLWGHSGIQVSCDAPGWRIILPVVVHVQAPVLILTHAVGAGHTLVDADLGQQEADLTGLGPDVLLHAADAVGRVMASPAPAGYPLRAQLLRQPFVITSGQPVRVLVQGAGFSLETQAVALGNASTGQKVMMRTQAGKVITGVAQEAGVARIAD